VASSASPRRTIRSDRQATRRAGMPEYRPKGSQSRRTSDSAPMPLPSCIVTPGRITEPQPTMTCRPSVTGALSTPVNSAGTVGLVMRSPE
jgi:hypothetical protein